MGQFEDLKEGKVGFVATFMIDKTHFTRLNAASYTVPLIFHRKMMVGSKNIFFSFLPPKNHFFKDFIAQKITFLKKDASPGFWVKAF